MQEKKNKRLAVLLALLCVITAGAAFFGGNDGSVDVEANLFRNYDLKKIDEVILESAKGKVHLKFNGSRWILNNEFNADPSMIQVLFATLEQAEPKRPASSSMGDSLTRYLKEQGVKVLLLSSGDDAITFYAGGNRQKTQAFFSLENGNAQPYLMTIPGYRVYVSGIFELPPADWKDKLVFNFNWRNFDGLRAEFPKEPSQGFNIVFRDNYFAVDGLVSVDTAKLNDFLDDVSLLTAAEFAEAPPIGDSSSRLSPEIAITVKDIAQRSYTLELYRPQGSRDSRIPGLINGSQWAFFAAESVQNIFKKRQFFQK